MKLYVNSISTFVVLAASCFFLMSSAPAPINAPTSVKSYREWKTSMIVDAETRLKVTKESILAKSRSMASKDPNLASMVVSGIEAGLNTELKNMQDKYDKERLQLSMAHDLTITDYFVGYLTTQKELNKAIREVSGRLTAEEVAELMSAYANNFFASKPADTKQPSSADSSALTP